MRKIRLPSLIETPSPTSPQPPVPQEVKEAYARKFSIWQRFFKLITSPSEAMKDIALAPEYDGVLVLIILQSIIGAVTLVMVRQKLQFYGENAANINSLLNLFLTIAGVIAISVIVGKWLLKSFLVKVTCDSGSGWNFKTAACVTGYAYLADILISIISLCISWFLLPTFSVDTTNLQAATLSLSDYRSQLTFMKFAYSLPVSLIAIFWKSYLGGLGTRFGTREKCSLGTGFTVFLVFSLIGLLIGYLINP
jgi:hypothetical protein